MLKMINPRKRQKGLDVVFCDPCAAISDARARARSLRDTQRERVLGAWPR